MFFSFNNSHHSFCSLVYLLCVLSSSFMLFAFCMTVLLAFLSRLKSNVTSIYLWLCSYDICFMLFYYNFIFAVFFVFILLISIRIVVWRIIYFVSRLFTSTSEYKRCLLLQVRVCVCICVAQSVIC